jgi:hypothetical protein
MAGDPPGRHRLSPPRCRPGKTLEFPGSNLYGHINGGSELFLEFGFELLTVAYYRAGDEEVALELYRMSDPEAAMGIYLLKKGKETPDPAWPVRHTRSRFQLLGVQGRYYFQINNLEGKEAGWKVLTGLGRELVARLPESSSWKIPGWFPQNGLDPDSLRIIRGPYALESIFTFGEGDVLQLGRKKTAMAGRFVLPDGGFVTRILASYPEEGAARAAFQFLRSRLDSSLRILSEKSDSLVFQDYAGKFGKIHRIESCLELLVGLSRQP